MSDVIIKVVLALVSCSLTVFAGVALDAHKYGVALSTSLLALVSVIMWTALVLHDARRRR